MATNQRGLVVAPVEILDNISATMPQVWKVKSFDNNSAPKTQNALFQLARMKGWHWESKFDVIHGKRYLLFLYRDKAERVACFDWLAKH
jgi:hypothetical protein